MARGLWGAGCCLSQADARVSPSPDSAERVVQRFEVPGVTNYTALLLSSDGAMLYLGARELLVAVNTSHFQSGSLAHKVSSQRRLSTMWDHRPPGRDGDMESSLVLRFPSLMLPGKAQGPCKLLHVQELIGTVLRWLFQTSLTQLVAAVPA